MQAPLARVIVLWEMRAREIAEITRSSSALSQPLDVWMLLRGSLQIGRHQILSAQGILIQGKIKEGLLFVEISAALGILERKCCENVFKPITSNPIQKLTEGRRFRYRWLRLDRRLLLSSFCGDWCLLLCCCFVRPALFNDADKCFDCLLLVINKHVRDLSIKSSFTEQVVSIFAILSADE